MRVEAEDGERPGPRRLLPARLWSTGQWLSRAVSSQNDSGVVIRSESLTVANLVDHDQVCPFREVSPGRWPRARSALAVSAAKGDQHLVRPFTRAEFRRDVRIGNQLAGSGSLAPAPS